MPRASNSTVRDGCGWPNRRALWVMAAIGTVLVVVAAVGLVRGVPWGADHATTDPLDPVDIPVSVQEQAWEWQPPEGAEASSFMPIPSGLVAKLGDGAVALDGATGEQTWHYRRDDASLVSLSTTPDEDRLVLSFEVDEDELEETEAPSEELDDLRDLVVLDTETGELLNEQTVKAGESPRFSNNPTVGPAGSVLDLSATEVHHLTDDARLMWSESSSVEARSLTDDSAQWAHTDAFRNEISSAADGIAFAGQFTVSGGMVVLGSIWSSPEDRHNYQYRISGVDAGTGETLWEHDWPIGKVTDYPDPTFTVGEDSVALRLYPEDQGRRLDLESGEELASDLWPESGGLLDLTSDGYVALDREGAHLFDREGERLHTVDHDGLHQGSGQTVALSTEEALVALRSDPDDSDRRVLTVDEWDSGERTAQIPVDVVPDRDTRLSASYEFAAEPSPYLQQVPGAIALMDPDNGRIHGFTP